MKRFSITTVFASAVFAPAYLPSWAAEAPPPSASPFAEDAPANAPLEGDADTAGRLAVSDEQETQRRMGNDRKKKRIATLEQELAKLELEKKSAARKGKPKLTAELAKKVKEKKEQLQAATDKSIEDYWREANAEAEAAVAQQAAIAKAREDAQRAQKKLAEKKPAGSGFFYGNVRFSAQFGVAQAIGEMENRSGNDYQIANFVVSVYDANGQLLATGYANIGSFTTGNTKSFTALIPNVSLRQIQTYKIQFENGL